LGELADDVPLTSDEARRLYRSISQPWTRRATRGRVSMNASTPAH